MLSFGVVGAKTLDTLKGVGASTGRGCCDGYGVGVVVAFHIK